MSYLGSWKIDDLLTFTIVTTRVDTGNATDADSAPSYRVYEDETATPILTGTMALLDSGNTAGFYSEQITLSAANGFEKGKSYNIYIQATVNSVVGATTRRLQIEAEVDANRINWANVDNPTTAQNLSGTNIDADQVVASVTGAVGSVTGAVGSVTGAVGSVTGNVGGNVAGSVASVTGNVGGNVVGSVGSVTATVTANTTQIEGVDATNQIRDSILTDATRFAGADIAAIKAKTDNLPADPADESNVLTAIAGVLSDTNDIQTRLPAALVGGRMDSNVQAMANNVLTAAVLAADAANEIADAILSRDIDNVEASAALHSLCTAILKAVSRVEDNGAGVLETYRTNGTTVHLSQAIGTDASLDPIESLGVGA